MSIREWFGIVALLLFLAGGIYLIQESIDGGIQIFIRQQLETL